MFVAGGTTWMEGSCSILEGESIALLEALQEMVRRGVSHIILETDSKSLVNAIQHLRVGSSEFSSIVTFINRVFLSCAKLHMLRSLK
jgi:hypothetical protein